MKFSLVVVAATFFFSMGIAQPTLEDFGYRQERIKFQSQPVDFIIKSKTGEEDLKKPLLIFLQGSLAKPLIKYTDEGKYFSPFPFSEEIFTENYHLICIGKPGIPVLYNAAHLNKNGEYVLKDSGLPPDGYTRNANLKFYSERNKELLEHLVKQDWVDPGKIVVAGHSEGSAIAVKMASETSLVTHLIYSGGTPFFSRILSIISQDRKVENEEESWVDQDFAYWEQVLEEPNAVSRDHGFDPNKGTYTFSENLNDDFKELEIPVLITYGTRDEACPFNDMLRLEMIKEGKENIQFQAYLNREHNYFKVENGKLNYSDFGWNLVARNWLHWISENSL